jgi:branched-chain amino acid transport system ATP-binding protein
MLDVENLSYSYGTAHALEDISLGVDRGELVVVLGSNGAGKTTLLNNITGMLTPQTGTVTFDGDDITGVPSHEVWRRGLVQVPEDRKLFTELTVAENLELGAPRDISDDERDELLAAVHELFPVLAERPNQKAGTMSGGQQQQLAIGRGLMSDPELVMLDEPTLGLAPDLAQDTLDSIAEINDGGTTVLLVSQKAQQSLRIADRGHVLENGSVALSGTSDDLIDEDRVREAYLGL